MLDLDRWKQPRSFLQFLRQILVARWQLLLLLAIGVCLPLLVFEQLAVVVWRKPSGFSWDTSILLAIHATAQPRLDRIASTLTKFGVFHGVFPAGVVLSLVLLSLRRWRSLTYWLLTLGGSIVINRTVKFWLHRVRPSLWDAAAPELDFAFPSGHAMSSMTFVAALLLLTWGSRWSVWVASLGSAFVVAIGWTRLYLGVHFPSDILAGWLISIAWAIGVSLIIQPRIVQLSDLAADAPPEETWSCVGSTGRRSHLIFTQRSLLSEHPTQPMEQSDDL
ncbi:MAG: phosphatase PAP2 family protein [Tildeniella nuda ZEHNDER 1965/U140]|jgi:undecaprenyl-diphosphatase|nr:phosphatase PAP2 family protein [Tildeniella nuda ZEHNDER 1965/U140]